MSHQKNSATNYTALCIGSLARTDPIRAVALSSQLAAATRAASATKPAVTFTARAISAIAKNNPTLAASLTADLETKTAAAAAAPTDGAAAGNYTKRSLDAIASRNPTFAARVRQALGGMFKPLGTANRE